MTQSTKTRSKWNTANGTHSMSLGSRGYRVRLFENRQSGMFYCDTWVNGKKRRQSLRTRDRREAEREGKRILSELLQGVFEERSGVVTLGALWDRFRRECAAWLDNTQNSKLGDERSAEILITFFGADRDLTTLSENDQIAFQNARMQGAISLGGTRRLGRVRARTVESDINLLKMMLRWATRVRVAGGARLLQFNPLDGVRMIREKNELRPVATWERFLKTREALAAFIGEASFPSVRIRWQKIDLALVLAEATGRRLGSIRLLLWDDVDFPKNQIRWRADSDKKGKEWVIPMPDAVAAELRAAHAKFGVDSMWIFDAQHDASVPMDRHLFDKWLTEAEKRAGLPKLKGGLWHAYRRKWATERKSLPIKDVMAAGGWTDADTLLRSYQHVDRETLMQVMNLTHKHRDADSQ
jgi:integrase